jgi:CheY-like chemotaxis protein
LLKSTGNDVTAVNCGADAIRVAEAFAPEIVLLDLGLPDIDGREVARLIRQEPWGRAMLIVAVGGWGQDSDSDSALASGLDAHSATV